MSKPSDMRWSKGDFTEHRIGREYRYPLARGLEFKGARLDDEEFLEVFPLSLVRAMQWVRDGSWAIA